MSAEYLKYEVQFTSSGIYNEGWATYESFPDIEGAHDYAVRIGAYLKRPWRIRKITAELVMHEKA